MRDVFWYGRRTPQAYNYVIEFLLGGFTRWDSEYFLHIAQHGYQYEQCLAFFPLYPLTAFISHKLFLHTLPFLSSKDAILVAAVSVNVLAFVMAGMMLYKLTNEMFHKPSLTHISITLYCINPASIFMSTVYSESLFIFLVITGLLSLQRHHDWVAMVMFMLAGLTRSNGILLGGYLLWHQLIILSTANNILTMLNILVKSLVQVSMVMSSFVLFQLVAYQLFCHNGPTPLEWCGHTLPISYTYVQQHYWNVGWLKYYEMKQIPNFLLATPTILLCSYWLVCCYHSNCNKIFKGYDHW